jgi:hypothetical protein
MAENLDSSDLPCGAIHFDVRTAFEIISSEQVINKQWVQPAHKLALPHPYTFILASHL